MFGLRTYLRFAMLQRSQTLSGCNVPETYRMVVTSRDKQNGMVAFVADHFSDWLLQIPAKKFRINEKISNWFRCAGRKSFSFKKSIFSAAADRTWKSNCEIH